MCSSTLVAWDRTGWLLIVQYITISGTVATDSEHGGGGDESITGIV